MLRTIIGELAPSAGRLRLAVPARLLFPGERAEAPVATLSGGELFRATLGALLLAEPAPQLLMLDEPTNNLDLPAPASSPMHWPPTRAHC